MQEDLAKCELMGIFINPVGITNLGVVERSENSVCPICKKS